MLGVQVRRRTMVGEERLSKLLLVLQQVLVKVGVHRTATGQEMDITNRQVGALGLLIDQDSLTMSQLSQSLFIDQSAATRIVDALIIKRLIERVPDSNDRRVIRIKLTDKGREIYNNVCDESSQGLSMLLAKMKFDDQEALIRGLEALIQAVHEKEQGKLPYCEDDCCEEPIDTNAKKE